MIEMTSKNKFYISLMISLVILAAFLFLCWLSVNALKNESQNLRDSQGYFLELEKKKEKVSEALDEYNTNKESIDALNSAILSEDEDLELVVLIENAAKANLLNHEISINEIKDSRNRNVKDINFQVNVSGAFLGVLNFIKYIENAPYYLSIKNITLDRVTADIDTGKDARSFPLKENDVRASLIIKVYTF